MAEPEPPFCLLVFFQEVKSLNIEKRTQPDIVVGQKLI